MVYRLKYLLIILYSFTLTGGYLINASWEDGSRSDNGKINLNPGGLACTADCMQISDSFARLGNHSQRSIVDITNPCTCGGSIRCEGKVIQDTSVKSVYYAASLLPRLYYTPATDNKEELSLQWKIDTDNLPPVSLWEKKVGDSTHWFLEIQVDTTRPNPTNVQVTVTHIDLGTLYTDVWSDFAFAIDWQPNYTGSIAVYLNSNLVTTYNGANSNAFYNPSQPAYRPMRFGLYKFPWCSGSSPAPNVGQKIMYYDVLRIGNSDMTINDFFITEPPVESNKVYSSRKPANATN